MGLISHQLETAGIATVGISTAKDITQAVRMPRAAFLDFPQGYTTGKTHDASLTVEILKSSLQLIDSAISETFIDLAFSWSNNNDEWKDSVFKITQDGKATDDRLKRSSSPQYQTGKDNEAAVGSHERGECMVCIGIDY